MALLFRSKSCHFCGTDAPSPSPNPSFWDKQHQDEQNKHKEIDDFQPYNPISTPFISPGFNYNNKDPVNNVGTKMGSGQFPVLTFLMATLRKSLLSCSVEFDDDGDDDDDHISEDISSLDISCPTDVQHLSHVTFDRFDGFLGLPLDFQPQLPSRIPSASTSVFGVSPQSMQCSIDERGNSMPTILLMMQKHLYLGGGLRAEGIFRINAENSQEECVRSQLNKGVVPNGIDVHCLAGLIKAWFRELPKGVLDSLAPEQVMHCNTEDQCIELVKLLPPTEVALLDWAVNLMADVAENEHSNKMNARNIAMVFAPNMTQMADPLTALIHAVQVMNFLKTLILRILRVREESTTKSSMVSLCADIVKPSVMNQRTSVSIGDLIFEKKHLICTEQPQMNKLLRSVTLDKFEFNSQPKHQESRKKHDNDDDDDAKPYASFSEQRHEDGDQGEGILDRLNLRKGVKKLCRYPVFQSNKYPKKTAQQEL